VSVFTTVKVEALLEDDEKDEKLDSKSSSVKVRLFSSSGKK